MPNNLIVADLSVHTLTNVCLEDWVIAGGTGFGTMVAVWLGSRRLFDERQRLRLDRLR